MLTTDMARPFLESRPSPASLRIWTTDAAHAVSVMAAQIAPGAVVLPQTRVDRRLVHPMVCFSTSEVLRRKSLGAGPILDREALLRDAEGLDGGPKWQPPLTIAGFATTEPIDKAMKILAGLRAYARTVAITPLGSGLDTFQAAEFDVAGIAVAEVDRESDRVITAVPGFPTSAPQASISPFWMRLRQEQLFALAMRANLVPHGI